MFNLARVTLDFKAPSTWDDYKSEQVLLALQATLTHRLRDLAQTTDFELDVEVDWDEVQ